MSLFFQELYAASQAAKDTVELKGRNFYLTAGIVTDNRHPEGQRRIKATTAQKGGKVETDWLQRATQPSTDEELPKVGDTVILGFQDGDPHKGVFFGVLTNDVAPPLDKQDPVDDFQRETTGNHTLKAGKTIRIENEAGAYLELSKDGSVKVGDAFGNSWQLGAAGASLQTSQDATINGKSQATLGAKDNRGDVLVSKGW